MFQIGPPEVSQAMKRSMLAAILLVFSLTPLGHGQPSAANNSGLIRSAIEHRWQDEGRANEFTFIELWHNKNFDKLGEPLVDESAKFESISLGGKAYLRMIEDNGIPLKGEEVSLEEESYSSSIKSGNAKSIQERISEIVSRSVDLGINLDLIPGYFQTKVIGVNSVNGRDAFEYLCTPRIDMKPKDKADRKAMQYRLRVWVDTTDLRFSKIEAELLTDQNNMLAGTTALITWAASDGVWLPQQMIIKGKAKEGRSIVGFETDYRYSDYKKFHSNSRIVGVPVPIHLDTPR